MSKSTQRNRSKLFILALVLLLPGFLYLAIKRLGSNEYVTLPVFGEKRLSGEMKRNWGREYPDTLYHQAEVESFRDPDGTQLSFPNDTAISVVHLFYTRDSAFSRLMLDNVYTLAQRFVSVPAVHFYSLSVDPKESGKAVQAYVQPYPDVQKTRWHLLVRPSEGLDIFRYAKEQLLIDAMVDPADSSRFLISNQLLLLDSKRRIRGFYDSSQKGEVERLLDEIKLLMVEEIRNKPIKLEKK